MTLLEWADTVLLAENEFNTCYIALMEGDIDGYDLEVEIDNGVIGSTFFGAGNLTNARKLADELEAHLTAKGITVYDDRDEWEMSFGEDDD